MSSISFDRAVGFYDATRGYPPGVEERVADAIVAAAGATPTTQFLELGIGTGRIALPLIMRGYPYAGIDLSEPMMERLREKIVTYADAHPDHPPLHVDLRAGDSTALPYPAGQFDVVLAVHVLHLIANWRAAVDEALRVLKPGGVFLNCGDDTLVRGNDIGVRQRWEAIIADLGYVAPVSYTATHQGVAAYLNERGLQPEILRTVTWTITRPPRAMFDTIAQRLWSRTWTVPDAIFEASIRQLDNELRARYGDKLDVPTQRTVQFVITRARKP
jgi:SAM-dependent methyltransferase